MKDQRIPSAIIQKPKIFPSIGRFDVEAATLMKQMTNQAPFEDYSFSVTVTGLPLFHNIM